MTGAHLSNQRLLAFLTDKPSADAVRAVDGARVETGDVTAATEFLKTNPSPQVLLVEIPSADAAPKLLDALAEMVNPRTKVIATGKVDTLRFYQWLIEIGIHDYLLEPFTTTQLNASINKGTAASAVAASATPQVKKLIAVIGARGGVGTTTIATNLAAIFAAEQQLPTALVDLDVHFGSVALSLDLEPGRGMRDALEKPDRVDGLFLDRVMIKPFAGLGILSAEDPLQEILNPQANAGPVLFSALAEKFGIIVADVPRQMNPLTRHVLAHADATILVAEPHLIDLRDALRIKDYLVEQLKRPAPLLVLNREGIGGKQELPTKDFTKHFGSPPAAQIKLLAEAYAASAQGELLVNNPKLKAALDPLRALAARISGVSAVEAVPGETGGWRSKLKPRKDAK
jgi:pilus assembly protein CpaE